MSTFPVFRHMSDIHFSASVLPNTPSLASVSTLLCLSLREGYGQKSRCELIGGACGYIYSTVAKSSSSAAAHPPRFTTPFPHTHNDAADSAYLDYPRAGDLCREYRCHPDAKRCWWWVKPMFIGCVSWLTICFFFSAVFDLWARHQTPSRQSPLRILTAETRGGTHRIA